MAVKWKVKMFFIVFLLGIVVPTHVLCEDGEEATVSDESVESEEDEFEVVYVTPKELPSAYMMETFDDESRVKSKWISSQAKKEGVDEDIAKYDGVWAVESAERLPLSGDQGLVLKSKAKHAAIAAPLKKPFVFSNKPFVVQYEVNLQNGQECGGAYLKLLSTQDGGRLNLKGFQDKTPYTIMFGPDKCGNEFKLHFIFRHVNPLTGEVEEKHAKRPKDKIEEPFKDRKPHLYTLIIRPDNTYEISLDQDVVNSGSLLEDFTPPVNPPKEIDDPEDFMPEDWDEREKIPDPTAVKPDDWDEDAPMQIPDPDAVKPKGWLDNEPEMIPDPTSTKPEDWDDEMDGEWEAPLINNPQCSEVPGCGEWKPPMIDNPSYKGKWRPEMIDNPNYRGKWKPRKINNPDYFEDLEPFKMTSIDAVGIELWSMSDNILFDNIIITDTIADAVQFAQETFDLKVMKMEKGQGGLFNRIINYSNKNPWLYAVYTLLVAVPVVLIIVCCCMESKDSKEDEAAMKKKTDEPTEDDPEVDESPEKDAEDEGSAGLSEGEKEADDGNDEEEDDEKDEEDEDKAEKEDGPTRTSPRLRKARKD